MWETYLGVLNSVGGSIGNSGDKTAHRRGWMVVVESRDDAWQCLNQHCPIWQDAGCDLRESRLFNA